MKVMDKKTKEILFSQVVSIIGGLIAGTILAVNANKLLLIPGMLVILPGFLEMRGNISGSMAARLTSGLFLGFVNPKKMESKIVKGNILSSFVLALTVSLVLGIIAFLFNYIIFDISTPEIIFIPLIAGMIANGIEIPLTLFFTFYFFRKGHDPNNIMGPFVTSTGDITSVLSLLVVVLLV